MKISICITVFNEEKTVTKLLDSLFSQTKKADEIVVVDGGSKDKTLEIIEHYQKRYKVLKILKEKGSIAHGRNVAIEVSKNEIIAITDAGCVLKSDWFEKITEPFKFENIDIVAGFYEMVGDSPLQKASSFFHGIPPERYDPTSFLPSARSMAFRRKVWEEVGGFSEKLERAGEDTLFNYSALKKGFKMVRVKDAVVYWEAPKTLEESAKKFYFYAKGDAQAGIWWNPSQQLASHNLKITSIYFRYLIFFSFLVFGLLKIIPLAVTFIIFALYLIWSVYKWRDVIKDPNVIIWLTVFQIVSDFAVMIGFFTGTIKK